jgi:glycosyltransferase involved in cell wall biosynthesis
MKSSKHINIKVAVSYRVCQQWRMPVFERLAERFSGQFIVFHSAGVKGTKLENGADTGQVNRVEMATISFSLKTAGRNNAWVFCPFLLFHLFRYGPTVILVEGGSNLPNNISVFLYGWLKKVPVVWWTLGEIPGRKTSLAGELFRKVNAFFERKAAAVVGYSSVAMAYFERIGLKREKCFIAVNVVDTDAVLSEKKALLDSGFCRTSGAKNVLFVGALTKEKRIDRLLHSFSLVLRQVEDAKLTIIGDGVARADLEELAAQLKIQDRVIFVGRLVKGLGGYFLNSDVFVLPGLGGLAISESMAWGLPVICSRGDGCEVDLVDNGATGWIIPDQLDDEEKARAYADRIVEILSDEELRARMSRLCVDKIVNGFNVANYVDVLESALVFPIKS